MVIGKRNGRTDEIIARSSRFVAFGFRFGQRSLLVLLGHGNETLKHILRREATNFLAAQGFLTKNTLQYLSSINVLSNRLPLNAVSEPLVSVDVAVWVKYELNFAIPLTKIGGQVRRIGKKPTKGRLHVVHMRSQGIDRIHADICGVSGAHHSDVLVHLARWLVVDVLGDFARRLRGLVVDIFSWR